LAQVLLQVFNLNGNPNAEQKRWHSWLRTTGCVITEGPCEIQHIKGCKWRLKGIEKPGEWYVIPLSFWHHRDPRNNENVTDWRKRFEKKYGSQQSFFIQRVQEYEAEFNTKPMSEETYLAILRG
jgi:hypothetical protein